MIKILNIGLNHETAPVELRECLAREEMTMLKALESIRKIPIIREGLFLSTCNRVEALCITERPEEARRAMIELMARLGSIPEQELSRVSYAYEDMEAVGHVFRVASSLDSMVVGEPQILGQIKEAYYQATKEKTSGVILNRIMHRAFHAAKRVRTETGISDAAVSISYAAVELARKIFYELEDKKILLIGAGEMAELAAKHLLRQGCGSIRIANRTFERALELAGEFGGEAVSFEEIGAQVLEVDIVITSTASREVVIEHDLVKKNLRKRRNRPLFFIDIAVPRDVDPRVNTLGNVYVYDIDDLKSVTELNKAQRRQEAVKAERIIQEEVLKFEKWLKTLAVVPTIISLREKTEDIRRTELGKSLGGLRGLTPDQMKAVEVLTVSITEKIINDPIVVLKRKAERTTRDHYIDTVRTLFRMDQENGGNNEDEHQ